MLSGRSQLLTVTVLMVITLVQEPYPSTTDDSEAWLQEVAENTSVPRSSNEPP